MITPAEISRYRETAKKLRLVSRADMDQRRQEAWAAAQQAAALLRQDFHATRVVVFGSLARETGFTRWSDVDMAVWGLDMADTFRAIGAVMDISDTVELNLTDANTVDYSLLQTIETEGVDL